MSIVAARMAAPAAVTVVYIPAGAPTGGEPIFLLASDPIVLAYPCLPWVTHPAAGGTPARSSVPLFAAIRAFLLRNSIGTDAAKALLQLLPVPRSQLLSMQRLGLDGSRSWWRAASLPLRHSPGFVIQTRRLRLSPSTTQQLCASSLLTLPALRPLTYLVPRRFQVAVESAMLATVLQSLQDRLRLDHLSFHSSILLLSVAYSSQTRFARYSPSVAITAAPSARQHQSCTVKAAASQLHHQCGSIAAAPSKLQHRSCTIRAAASQLHHQSCSIRAAAS